MERVGSQAGGALGIQRSLRDVRLVAHPLFYCIVPLISAVFALAYRSAAGAVFDTQAAYFVHSLIVGLPMWLATIVATKAWLAVLRRRRPDLPFLTALILGVTCCMVLVAPLSTLRSILLGPHLMPGSSLYAMLPYRFDELGYCAYTVFAWLSSCVMWIMTTWFYVAALRIPVFGLVLENDSQRANPLSWRIPAHDGAEARRVKREADARALPTVLLAKLPARLGRRIVALEAQEHYIKVYTDLGAAVVHHRFGDAVLELSGVHGLRVHRSWWIRLDAVRRVTRSARGVVVTLGNGLAVPVSRSYRVKLDEAVAQLEPDFAQAAPLTTARTAAL